jgi:hypothetical protein
MADITTYLELPGAYTGVVPPSFSLTTLINLKGQLGDNSHDRGRIVANVEVLLDQLFRAAPRGLPVLFCSYPRTAFAGANLSLG